MRTMRTISLGEANTPGISREISESPENGCRQWVPTFADGTPAAQLERWLDSCPVPLDADTRASILAAVRAAERSAGEFSGGNGRR